MSKKVFIGIGVFVILVLGGAALYILRPTAEASTPIEAVAIQVKPKQVETESSADSMEEPLDTQIPEEADEPAKENPDQPQGVIIFSIIQEESQVRFTLNEILRGNPKTVVGVTDQVAGEIAIDVENPVNSQVGTILVNARTLVTDNDFRNRAIKNEILDTGDFEFITFTPISISDFPANPQIGEDLLFKITGELTIRDVTREVTFEAKVSVNSETNLTGYASTMVARADYDLTIPEVQNVADVDEEVLLEIEFIAEAK